MSNMTAPLYNEPLQANLSLLAYIITRAPVVWSRALNQSVEMDVAWSLANCLEVMVAHRLRLVTNGPDWSTVLRELDDAGVKWPSLVQTCCELCTLSLSDSSDPGSNSLVTKENAELSSSVAFVGEDSNPADLTQKKSHVERLTDIALGADAVKFPDAHRCENGARALGYLLRILEAGFIRDQKVINQLFESMCEAMITNKVSSAEKIRWNANFAVGHLFQNTELWTWLSSQWTGAQQKTFADPLASMETAELINKLIRHLCYTFGRDKYFKARVYAANSLLGLFVHRLPVNSEILINTLHSSLIHTASKSTSRDVEFHILDAAFHIVRNVHDGTASMPCCTEFLHSESVMHSNFYSTGSHLSESKYRQQCLHLAVVLIFYALGSWLHQCTDPETLDRLESCLITKWLCPVVLNHLDGHIRACARNDDSSIVNDCKHETIYPRPMILSHLLELTDNTSPSERLQQAVELFQSHFSSLSCTVGPGLKQLVQLTQNVKGMPDANAYCIDAMWNSLDELQKAVTIGPILPDISKFRQIYD
ncbi:unnamed protein product [Echinostoma caproni]|uniref:DUF3437 domain-containing protein n=1 Tax=Echinostoma caproni TaxID=27848 RepID=A0A183AQ91_9TREM|nr:unnamed protein product [Echinostoma caproni]